MAAVAAIAIGGLPAAAAAGDAPDGHHRIRHHARTHVPYEADPAVRGDFVMNGLFDWRRRGGHRAWYAHGYSDNCVAWEKHAYHYACDENGRY
jgi:hypothetical protein